MMKNLFFGALVLSVAALSACSDSKPSGDAAPAADTAAASSTPMMAQPATTAQPGASQADTATTTAPATGVTAAPASGSAAAPTTPQTSQQVQVAPGGNNPSTVQVNPQQAVATPPGMSGKPNPAHGQPGHSCAIPVGQKFP